MTEAPTLGDLIDARDPPTWTNDEKRRNSRLKDKYGICLEEYHQMLDRQGGGCAICGVPESGTKRRMLYVDHCHESGEVRGLLCHRCNVGIGYFDDQPERIVNAAAYVLQYKGAVT